jgi:hypothetical protein
VYNSLKVAFIEFACEWVDCKAELHNFETLKKHVCKMHLALKREDNGPWKCEWGTCPVALGSEHFNTKEQLRLHTEEKHMVPFQ